MNTLNFIAQAPHAPFELFGIGPEMFADRGKAWVEALAIVLETMIAKIGVLILAALAVRKTILSNNEFKQRLDRQGKRLDQVALAVPPAVTSTVRIEQPAAEPIPVKEAAAT